MKNKRIIGFLEFRTNESKEGGPKIVMVENPHVIPGSHPKYPVFETLEAAESELHGLLKRDLAPKDEATLSTIYNTAAYNMSLLRAKYKTDEPVSSFARKTLKRAFNWDDALVGNDPINDRCQSIFEKAGELLAKIRNQNKKYNPGHTSQVASMDDQAVDEVVDFMDSLGFDLHKDETGEVRLLTFKKGQDMVIVAAHAGDVYTLHITGKGGARLSAKEDQATVRGMDDLKMLVSRYYKDANYVPSRSEYEDELNDALDRKDYKRAKEWRDTWGKKFYGEGIVWRTPGRRGGL